MADAEGMIFHDGPAPCRDLIAEPFFKEKHNGRKRFDDYTKLACKDGGLAIFAESTRYKSKGG